MRKETFKDRPDLIVDWRVFILPVIVMVLMLVGAYAALAQTPDNTLPRDHQQFKELMCRMVIGNVQSRGPTIQLYRNTSFTWTDGTYGLLTGFYTGDRGTSVHGPTLDDPKAPRFLKNGMEMHNEDVARLRTLGQEFRQGACDQIVPDPDPEPTPKA